jgi:hypothetical protein
MELGAGQPAAGLPPAQLAALPQHPLHRLQAHTRIAAGTGESDRRLAERQLDELAVERRCQAAAISGLDLGIPLAKSNLDDFVDKPRIHPRIAMDLTRLCCW